MNCCFVSSYPTTQTQCPPSTCSFFAGKGTIPVFATFEPSKDAYTVNPITIGYSSARQAFIAERFCTTDRYCAAVCFAASFTAFAGGFCVNFEMSYGQSFSSQQPYFARAFMPSRI